MNPRLAILLGSLNLILAQSTDGPTINTPASVTQCLPSLLQFHGGAPPYIISVIPGGQVGAPPLAELGQQSGDSMTWVANLPSGTSITFMIRDQRGNMNYSQMLTIQPNSNNSCLNSGSNPSPTSSPAPGPTTPSSSGSPSVTTGVSSAPPSTKPNNNTAPASGAQPNGTSPTTVPNTTASTPNVNNNTSSTSNSSKGPSPFVPPTSNTSPINSNNANPSSATSAAYSISAVCHQALFTGLTFAALAIFA